VESVAPSGASPLDRFFSDTDLSERHETTVRAPAALVYETARNLDLGSLWLVQRIFWLRGRVLGAREAGPMWSRGFVGEALAAGWGVLAEEPGRLFIAGGQCQPWMPDVVFSALPPEGFAAFSEPDRVKIAWTLEAQPVDASVTRFITETRAVGTDAEARRKFRLYLRVFKVGILAIRWMMVPAVRRQAERRWRGGGCRPRS
jgi:hypothetical protein